MSVVAIVCALLVGTGGVLALVRIERGPSMLDRTIGLDVFTATLVGVIAVEAAFSRRTETIPILVVLSLVGFVGSVVISRFAAVEPEGEGRIRTREEILQEDAARLAALEAERESASDPEHHGDTPEGEVR